MNLSKIYAKILKKAQKMTDSNKKSFIPYIFFIFFGIIFAVDATFIYFAKKTSRGIQTQDSYKKGINYNETLEAAQKQRQLGWKTEIKYEKIGKNSAILRVKLLDKNGLPIKNAKIIASFVRPTQEGYDFKQDFIPENNEYFARINFPLQGVWDVEIQAFKDDDIFQEVKRYIVK